MPLNGSRSLASLAAGAFNMRGDSSRFLVVFDNADYDLGSWSKVTGLNVSWDACEYRAGDRSEIWTSRGVAKYGKISLSRATCPDSATVQEWLTETSMAPRPFSGSIRLLDWLGLPLVTWDLKSFYPSGWRVADFDTKASTVVLETLDLAHTGFLPDDVRLGAGAASGPAKAARR